VALSLANLRRWPVRAVAGGGRIHAAGTPWDPALQVATSQHAKAACEEGDPSGFLALDAGKGLTFARQGVRVEHTFDT